MVIYASSIRVISERVYIVKEDFASNKRRKTLIQKKKKDEDSIDSLDDIDEHVDQSIQLVLEENPKWKLLKEIIDEIHSQQNHELQYNNAPEILIFVREERTAFQLSEYLSIGRDMLHHRFHTYVERKASQRSDHVDRLQDAAEHLKAAESRRRRHGFYGGDGRRRSRGRGRGRGTTTTTIPLPQPSLPDRPPHFTAAVPG
eukprot:gb/GECH01013117.1/.p1 GENE.gb/GECH01013117.1/~~gb/GECH01013117.1/.p1  ORF type:complete len:201 (+),score=62.98 gb/GECH01013117.1/:1-603(+)